MFEVVIWNFNPRLRIKVFAVKPMLLFTTLYSIIKFFELGDTNNCLDICKFCVDSEMIMYVYTTSRPSKVFKIFDFCITFSSLENTRPP